MSTLPLEAVYNEDMDKIKTFERNNDREPAPIKISLFKNFTEVKWMNEKLNDEIDRAIKKLDMCKVHGK